LHGFVLRTRPAVSAKKYLKIWTAEGSPLLVISQALRAALIDKLNAGGDAPLIELGMLYSAPNVAAGLAKLQSLGADRILALPLFPQYSGASTGAAFDAVAKALMQLRRVPELRFVTSYHARRDFIAAWCGSIESLWQAQGRSPHILFSFHGVPQRSIDRGDPYAAQCHQTASELARALRLRPDEWSISFQSRVGVARWLQPYTFELVGQLPGKGIADLTVACPGFAVDCLETLEEIAIENRERFMSAGGKRFLYVPALNAGSAHAELLAQIVRLHTQGWDRG
jgi:ferrochelatase